LDELAPIVKAVAVVLCRHPSIGGYGLVDLALAVPEAKGVWLKLGVDLTKVSGRGFASRQMGRGLQDSQLCSCHWGCGCG